MWLHGSGKVITPRKIYTSVNIWVPFRVTNSDHTFFLVKVVSRCYMSMLSWRMHTTMQKRRKNKSTVHFYYLYMSTSLVIFTSSKGMSGVCIYYCRCNIYISSHSSGRPLCGWELYPWAGHVHWSDVVHSLSCTCTCTRVSRLSMHWHAY